MLGRRRSWQPEYIYLTCFVCSLHLCKWLYGHDTLYLKVARLRTVFMFQKMRRKWISCRSPTHSQWFQLWGQWFCRVVPWHQHQSFFFIILWKRTIVEQLKSLFIMTELLARRRTFEEPFSMNIFSEIKSVPCQCAFKIGKKKINELG